MLLSPVFTNASSPILVTEEGMFTDVISVAPEKPDSSISVTGRSTLSLNVTDAGIVTSPFNKVLPSSSISAPTYTPLEYHLKRI